SVLAHEITHVTQHHFTRAMAGQQRSLLYSIAALAVAIAAARSGGSSAAQATNAAIASAQAISIQSQLNYTRENEFEADRIGFQRLDAAGFDDNAMASLMQRLQKQTRFAESNVPSYLRTHPITYERISEAQARAQGKPYRQVPDSLDFHLVRALLKSYMGTPQEAVQYFDDSLKEKKYNSEIAARYGLVASLLRANDLNRAKVALAALDKIAPPPPMIEAMTGHVLMEAGDLDAAIMRFASALQRYPNKMQLVYDYPEALLKANRPREAVAFLDRELERFPNNGPLHRLAAQAYADLGKKMQQHRHQGEFYAWQGNLRGAVFQYEQASKAGDGDFYQASAVEAQLRILRRELVEQQANWDRNAYRASRRPRLAAVTLLSLPLAVFAQPNPQPFFNVVTLEASATSEVASDTLTVTLFTEDQGPDPAQLAARANTRLEQALATAKSETGVEAHSGTYQTTPLYDRASQITGWRVRAELVLEGRDFKTVSALAGKLQPAMKLAGMSFT